MNRFKAVGIILLLTAAVFALSAGTAAAAQAGVASFAPTGTVPDNASFRIVFRSPMVQRDAIGKNVGIDEFPFTVSPSVLAEGSWRDNRTFTARLLAPLKMGTEYKAEVRSGLTDLKGAAVKGSFSFGTEALAVSGVTYSVEDSDTVRLSIAFNMPVDPSRLRGFLSVSGHDGKELPVIMSGALPVRSVNASVNMPVGPSPKTIKVRIAAGFKPGDGGLGLSRDFETDVRIEPKLKVTSVTPYDGEIRVYFNFPVRADSVADFISISPAAEFSVSEGWSSSSLRISGDFKPRNRFSVTLRKGLRGDAKLSLEDDYTQAVIMPDLESSVSIASPGSYLAVSGGESFPIDLVNVKRLRADIWRLYENNIPHVARGEYMYFNRELAKRVAGREFNLSLPLNEQVRRGLPLAEMVGGQRGLFQLTIRDADKEYWDEASQILNFSDLGAAVRIWESGLLVWVNTLSEAKPVSGASVRVYSGSNQILADGMTDKDGIFVFDAKDPWDSSEQPRIAVISSGDDLTYVQLTRDLLSREMFETSGRPWITDGFDAAVISPRDIYRTGETVSFRTVVRNADMTVPSPFPVLFTARDPLGRTASQGTAELSREGGASFTLQLPPNALTGLWTLTVSVPGRDAIGSMRFRVEDFAPPRIEVKAESKNDVLTYGDVFGASFLVRWVFGTAGSNLPARASWRAVEAPFTPSRERWKGYTFGDSSVKFSAIEGEFNEGKTGNDGEYGLTLNLNTDWQAASAINITLTSEFMDDGGRWISGSVTRQYWPAPWLIGIAPADGAMAVGRDLRFKVAAIDSREEPAAPGILKAEIQRVSWNYNIVEIDGYRRWQSSEVLTKVGSADVELSGGEGVLTFRPEKHGTYMIIVSDADGKTRTAYRFYAEDPQYAGNDGSQLLDRVELSLDKEFYRIGDKAKVTIRAPFDGLLLLCAEGAGPLERRVIKADKAEISAEITVTKDMVPNAWLTAWMIRPVRADEEVWGSHRAVGVARLKTDLSPYRMSVDISAPDKIDPSSKLNLAVKLLTPDGKPAKGEVSVALVDDAVLGLTNYRIADLLGHFRGLRRLGSSGYDLYDQLIPIDAKAAEILHPSGGAAMAALAGSGNVSRFKILSLFEGAVEPDSNGIANIDLDLPEFSGRGRIMVAAASGGTFGNAEKEIMIARDVVTEVNLPRFAAPGDSFIAPFTVFNNSAEDLDVSLTVSAEGGIVPKRTSETMRVPAGGSSKWETEVDAAYTGTAEWKVVSSWKGSTASGSFEQTVDLPVRSPYPVTASAGSGTFEAGVTEINVPVSDFTGDMIGSLVIADTPAADVTRAASYLLNYQYGCLEQTISAARPFMTLSDAISLIDPELVNSAAVSEKTAGAIAKLQAMQLYDGSFAMWPGGDTPYNWGSIYAAQFLIEAKDAGVVFPEEMLDGVLNWLRQFMASLPSFSDKNDEFDDFTAKAYGAYVLALNDEKPRGWVEYLRENEDRMWPSGKIWLAGAESLIDGKSDALRAIGIGAAAGTPTDASRRTLDSDVRNDAVLLSMWLDAEPYAPETAELMSRLNRYAAENRWYSTQDNAAALNAIAKYSIIVGSDKSQLEGKLLSEGRELLGFRSGKPVSVPVSSLGSSKLMLETNGSGRGFYSWNIIGEPKERPKAEKHGVSVECLWLDADGKILDISSPVQQGTSARVILTVKPSLPISNLAVSFLLPAGFEIDVPRLEGSGTDHGIVCDARDDRLNLFIDNIDSELSYGFKLRAVTRGTFAVPPISAAAMYDPSVRFVSLMTPDIVIQ